MSLPETFLSTTCDIYRPFGSATLIAGNVPCRLVADFARSRQSVFSPTWTHYLLTNSSVDVRDGAARGIGGNSLAYADGDEIRVPAGAATPRFVVVWVEVVEKGTPQEYKRVFLMRHTA